MSLNLDTSDYINNGFINGDQKPLLVESLKEIGFEEYMGYKKENHFKEKEAIDKNYFRWIHKIGFVKNEKKFC